VVGVLDLLPGRLEGQGVQLHEHRRGHLAWHTRARTHNQPGPNNRRVPNSAR
jgi:hypothetical protein